MKFTANMDTKGLETTLKNLEQQLPFATAKALTQTGQLVKTAMRSAMQSRFDRPTPYTLNSLFLKPATKNNLVCEVGLKTFASKAAPPSVYLAPQVYGGPRQLKRSEVLMQRKHLIPNGMMWVPGSGATLDSFGNMSRGQIGQILSALSGYGEVGFLANKSFRRSARVNKTTDDIFVGVPNGGHLPLGVYIRTKQGHLKPLMIFIDHANYKILLPFGQIASTVYQTNFQDIFNQALRDALLPTSLSTAA